MFSPCFLATVDKVFLTFLPVSMVLFLATLAAAADPASCAGCHPEAYNSWKGSIHNRSASNAIFQAAWTKWPNGWCLQCHAPSNDQQTELVGEPARPGVLHEPSFPEAGRWKDGVDCVACHQRGDAFVTAGPIDVLGNAIHPLVHDPTFGSEAACASCHEFRFQQRPRLPFAYGDALAQSTVSEWRGSQAAKDGKTCQTCHMGEAGHSMRGGHDRERVQEALGIDVTLEDTDVVFTLTAKDVGHAIPTGDPFRRLELWLCATAACENPDRVGWFLRTLALTDTSWRIDEDLRVPADGSRTVRAPRGAARWWQLHYRYGERRLERELSADDVGYVIAGGPLESP